MDLNQVTVPCLDLAASVDFYRRLGLRLIVHDPPRYARFECPTGRATFSLHLAERAPSGDGPVVYFELAHLDRRVRELVDAGLVFESLPQDQPWLWREAYVRDPTGNLVCLYHAGSNRRFPPWRLEPALAIAAEPVASDDARALIDRLDAELGERYPRAAIHGLHAADLVDERLVFLVARRDGRAVGCGALRPLEPAVAEVKRMFVVPEHRNQGVARRLLRALEAAALARGWTTVRLETGVRQPESIALYRSAGYREIPAFGEYTTNPFSVCFERPLDAAPTGTPR